MDSLDTAFVQPFQGDRGAENALKLAAALAPRINFGSSPLQPGEGEGLRQLLGNFGAFAEVARQRGAEGQVLTGLQDALMGEKPWASLPVSSLPPAMQQTIVTEIGKQGLDKSQRQAKQSQIDNILAPYLRSPQGPSPASGSPSSPTPLTAPSASVQDQLAQPNAANRLAALATTGPVSISPDMNDLMTRFNAPAQPPTVPPHQGTAPRFSTLDLLRLEATQRGLGALANTAQFDKFTNVAPNTSIWDKSTQQEVYRNRGPMRIGKDQDLVFFGPDNQETGRISGPTGVPTIRDMAPGHKAAVLNPDGTVRDWIYGPPLKETSQKTSTQFRQLVDSYKEQYGALEPTPDMRWGPGNLFGTAGQDARQQAEKMIQERYKDDPVEARAMRQAFREYFGPATQVPARPGAVSPQPPIQSRPMNKTATDFFKKYGVQ